MDDVNPLSLPDEEAVKFLSPRQGQPNAAAPTSSSPLETPKGGSNPLFLPDDEASRFLSGAAPSASPTATGKPEFLKVGREEPQETSIMDVVSAWPQTVGPSAKAYGQSLIEPFMHPKETAQAIGQLGTGLYSKARGALGYTQKADEKAADEAAVDQMAQYLKERYGSKEAVMRTAKEDPVAFFGDLSMIATGGGGLAARAPGVLGTVGKATAAVGSAIDPLNVALQAPKVAAKAVTSVTNVPLSLQSGASYRSLQQAVDAGANASPVFWEHLSGKVPASAVVERVNNAIGQVAKQRSDDYIREMTAATGRNPQQLNYSLVDKALDDAKNIAMDKGLVFDPKSPKVIIYNNVKNHIDNWKAEPNNAHTMAEFDRLKRELREYGYNNTLPGTPERKMLDGLAEAAKATIPDEKYVNIMEQYQTATKELNDLNKDLMNRRGSTTSQISKILKNQDKQSKGALIKRLEEIDPDLPAAIAGVELNPLMPSGLRGQLAGMLSSGSFLGLAGMAGHPGPLAGIALSSPRVGGLLNYGAGRATGLPSRVYQANRPTVEGIRQAGRAEEVLEPPQQASGGRIQRASGGRTNGVMTGDMLVAAAERAKKGHGKVTEPLLNQPDEAITRALAIANQHS